MKLSEQLRALPEWLEILEDRDLHGAEFRAMQLKISSFIRERAALATQAEELEQKIKELERAAERNIKALVDLRDHFLWRYMRTKKEGVDYDLPPEVIAANAAIDEARK